MASTADAVDLEVGETTPLVGSDDNDPPPLQELKEHTFKEMSVAAIAGVSFILSLLTLVFFAGINPLIWISALLGIIIAPCAAMQQHKLTQVEALAQTNKRLASEVDELSFQNGRLQNSVVQLEESVANFQEMEKTLSTLQSVQGQSLEELESQVKESENILKRIHKSQQGEVLQNLISVLIKADDDKNMHLEDDDIERAIHQLEGLHNINIDEVKMKQMIEENGRSIQAVLTLAKAVLSNENTHDDGVFQFVTTQK